LYKHYQIFTNFYNFSGLVKTTNFATKADIISYIFDLHAKRQTLYLVHTTLVLRL